MALSMRILFPMLLLVGCDEGTTPEGVVPEFVETMPDDSPALDLNLTQGHTEQDHTQVAPGVFVLTSLHESGEITFVPVDLNLDEDATAEEIEAAISAAGAPRTPISGSSHYCYNYDNDSYSQNINARLFDERPTFTGTASAYSYHYANAGGSYEYNAVYAGAYTYARDQVSYVYAYTYVYINDRYVGYAHQYAQNQRNAYAYGSWRAQCGRDLTVSATIYTRNYAYNQDGSYASVGTVYNLSADCCL